MENQAKTDNEEIDLKEIFLVLWKGKYLIITAFILSSLLSVSYALSLPNIYKSSAILAPVSHDKNSLNSLSSIQMGALANITGFSLPSNYEDKALIGIEVMKSMQFFSSFGLTDEFLIPLIASKGWNMSNNTLIIDEDIYSSKEKKWIIDKDD